MDALTGTPEAAIRSTITISLKWTNNCLSAALTKGAISDREMALFGSDQPKFSSAPYFMEERLANVTERNDCGKQLSNDLENNMQKSQTQLVQEPFR